MAATIVLGIMAWTVLVAVVAVLWLFIVRWDMIDRLATKDIPVTRWQIYPRPTEKERRQQELYVRYIKARHSGLPFDESEFSELPGYMRNEKFRRAWYALIGLIAASCVGGSGGFIVYVLATVGNS